MALWLVQLAALAAQPGSAGPIDTPGSAPKTPRKMTQQEARKLAEAFFRDRGEAHPYFQPYDVAEYPDFQFFQAMWPDGAPRSGQLPLHSAVDLRTGEYWDSVACIRLSVTASPSAVSSRPADSAPSVSPAPGSRERQLPPPVDRQERVRRYGDPADPSTRREPDR